MWCLWCTYGKGQQKGDWYGNKYKNRPLKPRAWQRHLVGRSVAESSPSLKAAIVNNSTYELANPTLYLSSQPEYRNRKAIHTSLFSARTPQATMPLVVPGLMSSGGSNTNQQEDWMNKLVGKKLTDSTSDTTVCFTLAYDVVAR